MQSYPLHSLERGSWFKLICGASYQHLPVIRNLALTYSLAGADCVDVAADPAVISAALAGIEMARELQPRGGSPWLMVSINDGEDPHFRKAKFEVARCPSDCPQPCVAVCPAEAIDLSRGGVIDALCYGCGRCIPICPLGFIEAHSHTVSTAEVLPWIESLAVDAIEIHTQVGHGDRFESVWQSILPAVDRLKLIAISCTNAPEAVDYLRSLYQIVSPLPCPLIWQTDGRSMSGDIGKGATHGTIAFARKVLAAEMPGYVQLAGGTNDYTVDKLEQLDLLQQATDNRAKVVSGVAYGSYARAILAPIFNRLEAGMQPDSSAYQFKHLEHDRELLTTAVGTASKLVGQIKQSRSLS